ncbi:MAG: hypothetical protein DVB25_06485 [Verrucomicrobia bacterium]|nr:MAG: hypothetical protein DVB25_06485 [Verrucomicrobiota bacterium]
MDTDPPIIRRGSSWMRTVVRGLLICAGSLAILLPAWLPNRPSAPLGHGTVALLQALLLAAASAVFFGATAHAGRNRPVCRILGLGLAAAVMGKVEDFASLIMGRPFPENWVVGALLLVALGTALRHRRVVLQFVGTLGHHAGSGLIAAALLILYVFDKVIGRHQFWQAALGAAFTPEVPRICRSYLDLLACYLLFIGAIGLALTLARREEPL